MSSSITGPTRLVAVKPWGGVARAVWVANAPRAQATNAPATIRFNVFLLIVIPPLGVCMARGPAVVGGAVVDEGAAVCGRPTLGRHPALLRSDDDSGTAVPSPTLPARRPGAGAVPGRCGPGLAARTHRPLCLDIPRRGRVTRRSPRLL